MNGIFLLLGATALFAVAYFLYGRLIERVLGVDPARATPAHTRGDGVDYVPAHPAVLFGHHFASIAGAGPIVGPIAAAYFGWGAVVLWVVLGCIFIGAVHDMVSLYLSVRHEGRSIASVIETVLGRPGKILFLVFCWSTLILVCAEFTRQVAVTFVHSPEVASSSLLFIALAVVFGIATNRLKVPVLAATIVFVPVMFGCIWVGTRFPLDLVAQFGLTAESAQTRWTLILLAYCFLASTLPVWLLLQPRDYLNSYLLYAMMALGFLGVFAAAPTIQLDAFAGWHAANAKGVAQPLFPILFITIACGACSGFHALVASGTTAKQLDSERHIRPVAYGGMLLEGILAVLALIAVGRFTQADLAPQLAKPGPVALFAGGLAAFCTKFGIPEQAGYTFMCLAVSAFLMTSVDTATRLARFTWQELFTGAQGRTKAPNPFITPVSNMYVATGLVVAIVALLLLGNPEAAKNLWNVFASANQLLAGLTLFTASLWLYKNGKAWWVTLFPMLFMLAVSSCGLYLLCTGSWKAGNPTLGVVTAILLALAGVLVLLAILRFAQARGSRGRAGLVIFLLLAASSAAQGQVVAGSLPSYNRDSEWRASVGAIASVSGTIKETFRAFYAATGQDSKQSMADSYKLSDFGVDTPYYTLGAQYGCQWDYFAFHWDFSFFDISADAKAKRNYYLGVGSDISYHGRKYDHLQIPKGQKFSLDFLGGMMDFTFSITPFSLIFDESIKLTPSLDLGLVLIGGQYEIDAGSPRGTTVYQNPPVDFVIGGSSDSWIGAAAPRIGVGSELRIIYENDVEWVTRGGLGYFSYDGSTKPFTSAGHRKKEIDISIFSLMIDSGFVFPLDDDSALTLGGRVQYLSIDAEIKSKEKDTASIIAARERFDKSADLSMLTLMVYVGYTY